MLLSLQINRCKYLFRKFDKDGNVESISQLVSLLQVVAKVTNINELKMTNELCIQQTNRFELWIYEHDIKITAEHFLDIGQRFNFVVCIKLFAFITGPVIFNIFIIFYS